MFTSNRYYSDQCPSCARHLHVDLSLFGQVLSCGHCYKSFRSTGDADSQGTADLNARISTLLNLSSSNSTSDSAAKRRLSPLRT